MISDDQLRRMTVHQAAAVPAEEFVGLKAAYTTANLPDPASVPPGFTVWNTDEAAANYSDGTQWISVRNTTRIIHQPIAAADRGRVQPAAGPSPIVIGSFLGLEYTTPATDALYSEFKIPGTHDGEYAALHIHWTKSADTDQSGNTVRWQVDLVQVDGIDDDINVSPATLLFDDTYDDAGTTTRIVHRASDQEFVATPNWYVGVRVSVVGASTTVANPVLISCDLRLSQYINL